MSAFSLPTQRCFYSESTNSPLLRLFSAYAEVFLAPKRRAGKAKPFLCLRRGVSILSDEFVGSGCFSLPTQRCFCLCPCNGLRDMLFSAYAEVFRARTRSPMRSLSFLCLRRGVSDLAAVDKAICTFSLPTQRCFPDRVGCRSLRLLFSAYAEVFLPFPVSTSPSRSFLCLRRGVSHALHSSACCCHFSLPTQRCFLPRQ